MRPRLRVVARLSVSFFFSFPLGVALGGCSFLFFSINALGILRRKLACDLALMSEGEELVAPAYLGPAMSRALRTAVDVGVFHCTLLFICSRCVRKQGDYTATRCRHRAGGSLCKITVTANVWRQRRKKRAAPSADERGKCFRTFLPRTTLLRDASENFEDFRNTFGARLRGIYRGAVLKSAALCRGTPGNSDITPLSSVGPLFV